MKTSVQTPRVASLALALLLSGWQLLPAQGIQPALSRETVPEPGVNVQARGPLHEAFAQPQDPNTAPPTAVPRQPPPPIPEEPPDQKPADANVQWIPGYWAWDSDKKDFVWVSGMWRVPPPERQWVLGHWTQGPDGWQWAPGYWSGDAGANPQFVPEPPDSLDNGPSAPAPNDSSVYVPGLWKYRNSEFVWRPGFWTAASADWVWTPPSYRWTPAGWAFVDGFWDYPLANRGLLFAPVAFEQPLWQTPGWYYRPQFVVGLNGLLGSLFVRPGYGFYYFGDYYDPFYARLGFYPWHAYGRRYYDPLFTYYHWYNRGNRGWYAGLHNTYLGRRDGTLPRPPRTFAQQTAQVSAAARGVRTGVMNSTHLVTPLGQYRTAGAALTRVPPAQLSQARGSVQHFRDVSVQRGRSETVAASAVQRQSFYGGPGGTARAASVERASVSRATQPRVYSTPSFSRSAPTFRGGSSYHGSGMHFSGGHGGGHASGGHGGHGGGGKH
jgi:hypothetical protein